MDNVATHEDWRVCFASLAPGLLLFARQWVRSRADAEDVVQEAFVRLWRRSHPIDTGAAGSRARETGQPELGGAPINRALLYAAVRSIALDLIRRDSRRARREAEAMSESEQTIEPQFLKLVDEAQSALAAALDRLPHDQREVLVMKIWNELTFAEIATALEISQNTAASRYRYALAALKKTLQPR